MANSLFFTREGRLTPRFDLVRLGEGETELLRRASGERVAGTRQRRSDGGGDRVADVVERVERASSDARRKSRAAITSSSSQGRGSRAIGVASAVDAGSRRRRGCAVG